MVRIGLSNLQVRSNLLPSDNQGEYPHHPGIKVMALITAYEVKDILRRCPNRNIPLTPEQQKAWRARLFNGGSTVSMADGDRGRAWLEQFAEGMDAALDALNERADLERAFEVLCIAELLAAPTVDSHFSAKAAIWSKRARAILERPEFKLSREMLDERLHQVLGLSSFPSRDSKTSKQCPVAVAARL